MDLDATNILVCLCDGQKRISRVPAGGTVMTTNRVLGSREPDRPVM